jgi:4'-phosphopantetheinyl transferase
VTVAVQRGGAVGVDVEEIGRFDPPAVDELAREVLAAEEQAELTRLPAGERALAFTTYWTRKEAVVKATGEGLMASLDALVVSPPDQPPRIIRWDGRAAQARRLWLHPLQPRAGYVAALAAVGRAPSQVVEHDAGPILRGVPAG